METLRQDIRYAARTLWKARGFAFVAIVTLALGIGASTAIFSVMDNVLMEPFPYDDAQRFMSMQIHDTERNQPGGRGGYVGPEYLDYVAQNHVFDRVIANTQDDVLYKSGEGTELFRGGIVTPGTFEFLGMPALLGRVMQAPDYEPGAPPVFLLRYKTWVDRFGADPSILNKQFVLNGMSRTLIGVMPPRFGWGDSEVWLPEKPSPAGAVGVMGFPRYWFLMGHLKPGVSMKQAQADLDLLAHQLAAKYPKDYPKHFSVEVQSLTDMVVGQFRTTLYIMLAAVGLLLLIGCGNVANLLLARATGREKEFAIRAVLGAGRIRLIRQLLVESLILAVGGALLGTLIAWGGLKSLIAVIPEGIVPAESVIRLNMPVLAFTLCVAVLTALVFGLVPALQAAKRDLNDPLRDSGKGTSGGGSSRLRNAVVVFEVALSLTLMVGAGLLMRSFVALREVHLGFQPDHVLVARLPLPADRYKTADQMMSFYKPLLQRLRALPGVVDVTETSSLPPYGGDNGEIEIAGKSHQEKWSSSFHLSSGTYFSTLKMQFLEGRTFDETETDSKRKVTVVNQTFVKKFLGNDNPIGQRVHVMGLETYPDKVSDAWFEVIGVVADAKNNGLQDPTGPELWVPYSVTGSGGRGILVRTTQEPMSMLKSVQQEIWATDHGVALTLTGSLESFINSFSYAGPRFGFLLMSIFGGIGLILVTVGVYSVLAYTAAQRTREIGIRMALGAESGDVLKLVVSMGLRLVGLGAVIGVVASLLLASAIKSQLWGVSAHDPTTVVAVTAMLLLTGVVACWIPARRAARVDPLVALRYE
ncbi:MAG TPA: ABC transporter permease [Candidatus Acidoferrum sp.]|nr:ABC transporter permease [Candidatus Acidoferrum sp.]